MGLLGILQRPMEDQVSFIVTQTKFSSAPIPQTINNDRSLCKCKKSLDPNEIKNRAAREEERGERGKRKGRKKDRERIDKKAKRKERMIRWAQRKIAPLENLSSTSLLDISVS